MINLPALSPPPLIPSPAFLPTSLFSYRLTDLHESSYSPTTHSLYRLSPARPLFIPTLFSCLGILIYPPIPLLIYLPYPLAATPCLVSAPPFSFSLTPPVHARPLTQLPLSAPSEPSSNHADPHPPTLLPKDTIPHSPSLSCRSPGFLFYPFAPYFIQVPIQPIPPLPLPTSPLSLLVFVPILRLPLVFDSFAIPSTVPSSLAPRVSPGGLYLQSSRPTPTPPPSPLHPLYRPPLFSHPTSPLFTLPVLGSLLPLIPPHFFTTHLLPLSAPSARLSHTIPATFIGVLDARISVGLRSYSMLLSNPTCSLSALNPSYFLRTHSPAVGASLGVVDPSPRSHCRPSSLQRPLSASPFPHSSPRTPHVIPPRLIAILPDVRTSMDSPYPNVVAAAPRCPLSRAPCDWPPFNHPSPPPLPPPLLSFPGKPSRPHAVCAL
ncbi:hypothetical protein FKM82_022463 [Ascaphus truei]